MRPWTGAEAPWEGATSTKCPLRGSSAVLQAPTPVASASTAPLHAPSATTTLAQRTVLWSVVTSTWSALGVTDCTAQSKCTENRPRPRAAHSASNRALAVRAFWGNALRGVVCACCDGGVCFFFFVVVVVLNRIHTGTDTTYHTPKNSTKKGTQPMSTAAY